MIKKSSLKNIDKKQYIFIKETHGGEVYINITGIEVK